MPSSHSSPMAAAGPAVVDTAATRLATRLSFFAAGFAMAAWAPIVPFAKARTGVDEAGLGLLLLCLGVGSLIAMPLTGWVSARRRARPMILGGGLGLVAVLPLLAVVDHPALLAAALLGFGAALGTLDVAMNVHAVEVEKAADRPLMSGFHGLFSLGGVAGAGGMTLLLSAGAAPAAAMVAVAGVTLAAVVVAAPRLLPARSDAPPRMVRPRGVVLAIAALAAVTFLVEGALLDWSALLTVERGLVEPAEGGLAYMLFSLAMVAGRLTGDRVVAALGSRRVLTLGAAVTAAGFLPVLLAPSPLLAMPGFVLIGLGAANIVPVLFSLAGRQRTMPPGLAIAAVTTTGYAGILAGPAAIGFLSGAASLPAAFALLALLMAGVALVAGHVTEAGG